MDWMRVIFAAVASCPWSTRTVPCIHTRAQYSSTVLGYKGKSGAVPQKVLVYCLFWVSPDFFPPYKKSHKTGLYGQKH